MTGTCIVIFDETSNKEYKISKQLGKGSFGVCYRVVDLGDKCFYACKRINKQRLKDSWKKQLHNEIMIHRELRHKHVVGYVHSFEDVSYSYMILELCARGSMSDLMKKRECLTNPEVRYYLRQVLEGVRYLHERGIVHRDIKLANLLMTEGMTVKIGDFGFATVLNSHDSRRFSVCGTPNYVAPEIIDFKGHGFPVDVWSIGCVVYILLAGVAPFAAATQEDMFKNVRSCSFGPSPKLTSRALDLIERVFVYDPQQRPSVTDLQLHPYFNTGFTPSKLPPSFLHTRPFFTDDMESTTFKHTPLVDRTNQIEKIQRLRMGKPSTPKKEPCVVCASYEKLAGLMPRLAAVLDSAAVGAAIGTEQREPFLCVSRWVDHGDEKKGSGFGYQLTDCSTGVTFSDGTFLNLAENEIDYRFISRTGYPMRFTTESFPYPLRDKIETLHSLRSILSSLRWSGSRGGAQEDVFVVAWRRCKAAVVFFLSSGVLQGNFTDHTKVVVDLRLEMVTKITDGEMTNFSFRELKHSRPDAEMQRKLQFILSKAGGMVVKRAHSALTHADNN